MNKVLLKISLITVSLCFSINYVFGQTIDNDKATKIFKDLVRLEPIECISTKMDNKDCIVCLANEDGKQVDDHLFYTDPKVNYYKLSKFANTWRLEKQERIIHEEFMYCQFNGNDLDLLKIKDKNYLYFSYTTTMPGNATTSTTLSFTLFSMSTKKVNQLHYDGDPVYDEKDNVKQIKGDFTNLDEYSNKLELLSVFETKISDNQLIYRPTEEDLDLESAKNYEKLWEINNPNIKSVWGVKENTWSENLNTKLYSESIFPEDKHTIAETIENDNYKVIAMFRNNILAYDKRQKKYFPIWVESCSHGCHKTIQFLNESTLQITYAEASNQKVIIDLKEMTYKIIVKN